MVGAIKKYILITDRPDEQGKGPIALTLWGWVTHLSFGFTVASFFQLITLQSGLWMILPLLAWAIYSDRWVWRNWNTPVKDRKGNDSYWLHRDAVSDVITKGFSPCLVLFL